MTAQADEQGLPVRPVLDWNHWLVSSEYAIGHEEAFTEEQIIGFLRETEAGMPIAELCRKYAFSEARYYL